MSRYGTANGSIPEPDDHSVTYCVEPNEKPKNDALRLQSCQTKVMVICPSSLRQSSGLNSLPDSGSMPCAGSRYARTAKSHASLAKGGDRNEWSEMHAPASGNSSMKTLRDLLRRLLNRILFFYPTAEERTREDSRGN